jgi:hypothetical protein
MERRPYLSIPGILTNLRKHTCNWKVLRSIFSRGTCVQPGQPLHTTTAIKMHHTGARGRSKRQPPCCGKLTCATEEEGEIKLPAFERCIAGGT